MREGLARAPLAEVWQRLIADGPRPDDEVLAALGLPLDVLRMFRDPADAGSFAFRPAAPGARLLAESPAEPLGHLRLQLPESAPCVALGLKLLRALLETLPGATRFTVLARPGADHRRLDILLRRWGADPARVRFAGFPVAKLFARDNACCVVSGDGSPSLLLPRADARFDDDTDLHEHDDAQAVSEALAMPVLRSGLPWEGGNLLYDGHAAVVGANTIADAMNQLGLSEEQAVGALGEEFGVNFTVLGDVGEARALHAAAIAGERPPYLLAGGQADFHVDLDVCLLGRCDGVPTAVVADPDLGLEHLPAVLAHAPLFEHHHLPPRDMRRLLAVDLEATAAFRRPRLAAHARTLASLGYRVLRQPDLRLDPEHDSLGRVNTCFNYCNVLSGRQPDGSRTVYLLHYGVPALDEAASATFSGLGLAVAPVAADGVTPNELMMLGGGLHCLGAPLP